MRALTVHAGPRALARLRDGALAPGEVRIVPAAAGGPKGLVLIPLDRYLFGHWLARGPGVVHVVGASIGAWRMAAACRADADAALAAMAESYITQHYEHEPGRAPAPALVSAVLGALLEDELGPHADEVLGHPRLRLHVVTSRGRRGLLGPARLHAALGFAGAFVANLASRRALGLWLERVVFSDPRDVLPIPLAGLPTRRLPLRAPSLARAVLASCSIPLWLDPVQDLAEAPGCHWDGGLTDYHLHWDYAALHEGFVLYPHFQGQLVPGWLDKVLARRHRATAALDNVIVLAPNPQWVARLPGGRLPDRGDFQRFGDDVAARQRAWRAALAESARLADDFCDFAAGAPGFEPQPLA